ncbi:MAG: hypothetical protein WC313_00355 [Candidatus Kapaibacterium sp.]
MLRLIFYIMIIVSSLILTACPDSIGSTKDIIFPEENVSYTAQVEPFLNLTCAFAGCHGYSAAGGVILNDYFSMVNTPGLIVPGNPDGSLLIQIIDEIKPHNTYYEKSNITDNHKKGMRQWVKEGARLSKE